ncbi:MAG: SDR family oxidoreductase [Novosphingobium sp.]
MKTAVNTILVTGGGSGIGRELARAFQSAGNTVIVAGRRLDALVETIGTRTGMSAIPLDIADGPSIAEFTRQLIADHPGLNVVVNNAGIMLPENAIDLDAAEATVATNLLGPIRLTGALLPHLRTREHAVVINVSSALAFVPFSATPTYCATKAALHSWTVSLRQQLRSTVVEVIEIIPPAVQTELQPGQSSSPYAMPLDAYMAETLEQLARQPTPAEIFGPAAAALRGVVDDERFNAVFGPMNGMS